MHKGKQGAKERLKLALEKDFPEQIQIEFAVHYLRYLIGGDWSIIWRILSENINLKWRTFLIWLPFTYPKTKAELKKMWEEANN